MARPAFARNFGPDAEPTRYPDPDIIALDKRFNKYKLGNTPIQRLYRGTLWAEGPAWRSWPLPRVERYPQQSNSAGWKMIMWPAGFDSLSKQQRQHF
jgi:hypothetical protein